MQDVNGWHGEDHSKVDYYGAQYGNFASALYSQIRAETFGEDIGQNGWLTADEQDRFIAQLALGAGQRLLDVACGSGGPALRMARVTGCELQGIDIHEDGITNARASAELLGLAERARFDVMDAAQALAFPEQSFDAVVCVDALNHLPDRAAVLAEWVRVLKPGGRLLFTDPIVVTGPLTNHEIAVRSSIGFFLFVPQGTDERMIAEAGLELVHVEDATENMASMAERWQQVRSKHEADLRQVEGDHTYEGQQAFLQVAARVARQRRLSRFIFVARQRSKRKELHLRQA